MYELQKQHCEVCRIDAPKVTADEIQELSQQIPDWRLFSDGGIDKLTRTFSFKNFVDALTFTQAVGVLAEQEGHHPAILTEWGKVTVTWWTHKINGLHRNDFIMAARTDEI